ncbi:MAG: hypothetical protein WC802_01115 [Patescibacteria group bacterium]|jgi:hypothetical protein
MRRFIIPAIIFVLSLGLLVFARLNAPEQTSARLFNMTANHGLLAVENPSRRVIHRGEDLKTDTNEWRAYKISVNGVDTLLWLDENTILTLEDSSGPMPKFALRQGRVVVQNSASIMVRNTEIKNSGTVSLVFYSWLDKLDVAYLETSESYTLDTLHPETSHVETTFNPFASSASDFYKWALGTQFPN